MRVECPHCYVRVIPSKEGVCPACQKNVRNLDGANPNLTRLNISGREKFPSNCYHCDVPTTRYVTVRQSFVRGSDYHPFLKILAFPFIVVFHGLIRLIGDSTSYRQTLKVRLPQCKTCAANGSPKPDYADFEKAHFTFIVHRNFRDRVRALNESMRQQPK